MSDLFWFKKNAFPIPLQIVSLEVEAEGTWYGVDLVFTCGRAWRWFWKTIFGIWARLWPHCPILIRDYFMVLVLEGGERLRFWNAKVKVIWDWDRILADLAKRKR